MSVYSVCIDLLLIGLFLFFLIRFAKYGFARTVYKIGKTWLSLFCSAALGPWVASWVEKFIDSPITNGIHRTLQQLVENNANEYNLGQVFENLPAGFVRFLEHYGVDFAALEAEYGSSTYAGAEILRAISERLSAPCVENIASAIGHAVCFVVSLLFFAWLNFEIKKRRFAFFRYVDQFAGIVAGLAIGYCASFALALIIHMAFQVVVCFNAQSGVTRVYGQTYVLRFLNEFNVIEFLKNVWQAIVTSLPF